MDDELKLKIEALERDVDTIQNKLIKADAPWYENSSFWISIVALLFSFGTTWVSYKKADAQDIQSARQELRGLLQRLAALPKENLEASRKYAGDPASLRMVSGFIVQENALLSRQASEIARKLPKDVVSPTEYYAVAIALALDNAYEATAAREFVQKSLTMAEERSDFNSEITAMRMLGALDFRTGKVDQGRAEFQNARTIFTRYPDFDQFTQVSTNVWTELNWASMEAVARSGDQVRQHLDSASSLLASLPPSPGLDTLRGQVDQAQRQYAAMGVVASPTVPALVAPATPPSN